MTQQYPPQPPPHGAYPPHQQSQWMPPAAAPPAPKTSFWRSKKAAGLLLVGALMAACGLANGGSEQTTQNRPGVASGVSAEPDYGASIQRSLDQEKAAQPQPEGTFGPGTYEVGVDIQPGKYKTAGGGLGGSCYWARLKDTNGELDSIIANGNAQGPTTVTIKSGDGAFETTCETWTKAG